MPELVVIAAVAEADRLIGDGLELPWHIPADLKRFKALTVGHPLLMGRRTFESLVHQFGGPLPNRENVVLTRDAARGAALAEAHGVTVAASLDEALDRLSDAERVFVGGGAGVYGAVLGAPGSESGAGSSGPPRADRLELTMVEGGPFTGDTYFPPFEHLIGADGPYRLTASERHPAADGRPAFRFDTWMRNPTPG